MAHDADVRKVFLEALEKTSFINVACKRAGISRTTYYRWIGEDLDFRIAVKQAMKIGRDILGEAAYSVVQKKVKEGDLPAAKFVLTHYPSVYGVGHREEGNLRKEAEKEAEEDWENLTLEQRKKLSFQQLVKAFTGPDGKIHLSKAMLEYIEQKQKEEAAESKIQESDPNQGDSSSQGTSLQGPGTSA